MIFRQITVFLQVLFIFELTSQIHPDEPENQQAFQETNVVQE